VKVDLKATKPLVVLRVTGGDRLLRGVLEVTVSNMGKTKIELQNFDVHGFLFIDARGKATPMIHTCECGFLVNGHLPDGRNFQLEPNESRKFHFGDFECHGGPYRFPEDGTYRLLYRIRRPAPIPPLESKPNLDLLASRCAARLLDETLWQEAFSSNELQVTLRTPGKRKSR